MKYTKDWYSERYYHKGNDCSFIGGYTNYTPEKTGWIYDRAAKHIIKTFGTTEVFDFGTGQGLMVKAYQDMGIPAYGSDWSDYAVQNAYAKNIIQEDLSQPLTHERKYDTVQCFDVLEHIDEQYSDIAIRNIINRTKRLALIYIPLLGHPIDEESHVNLKPRVWWQDKLKDYGLISSAGYKAPVDWFAYIECLFIVMPPIEG